MHTPRLAIAIVLLSCGVAHADEATDDTFTGLDQFGQFGLGFVARVGDRMAGDDVHFNGTFRLGKVWRATNVIRPGGFAELRTVSFDNIEAAIGPQLQFRLGEDTALQLRAGVGANNSGPSYGLVGAQIGTALIAVSMTARKDFDGGPVTYSANLELAALLPLFPLVVAAWR